MRRGFERRIIFWGPSCAIVLFLFGPRVLPADETTERATVHVVVKDAETGQPISQAHLTLQFHESGKKFKPKLPKHISYSAKTNAQGRCKFTDIPRDTIRLIVTAERHQTFGKEFELEKENQVIEVALKKPEPLL